MAEEEIKDTSVLIPTVGILRMGMSKTAAYLLHWMVSNREEISSRNIVIPLKKAREIMHLEGKEKDEEDLKTIRNAFLLLLRIAKIDAFNSDIKDKVISSPIFDKVAFKKDESGERTAYAHISPFVFDLLFKQEKGDICL